MKLAGHLSLLVLIGGGLIGCFSYNAVHPLSRGVESTPATSRSSSTADRAGMAMGSASGSQHTIKEMTAPGLNQQQQREIDGDQPQLNDLSVVE